ncbi:hypothetical protein [Deinococcus apachensis]|uniref:hypothetical protein n=1 Tax=Deinococcus apachensis TaxID=309886 RepID=UPI0003795890|nr:hypothetical protein [Deinococcus apachensis]
MTSLTGTPAALTAYLRRATWGLPKARQQELWDELEEHVLTRVDHLCALGALPQEATFYNNQAHLRFVSTPAQLTPNPINGRIPALLVRVTNVPLRNLKSGIFLPTQRTSDAN